MPEFIFYLFHHMLFVEIYLTCIAKWHIKMKKIVIFSCFAFEKLNLYLSQVLSNFVQNVSWVSDSL